MDFSNLEKFIFEKMSETHLPGLTICLIKDGELVYSRGFGFKDVSSGLPATPRTLFGIGSVTKSFTALAIMQLFEKGLLDVEDPVSKYVSFKIKPFGEDITIHHFLTHSSGIPALAYAEAFIRNVIGLNGKWLPVGNTFDILAFMEDAGDWVHSKPGERFFYLNEGYVILGEIISKVSGVRYEDYIRENIFKPLKMDRTYFTKSEVEKDGDFATPYIVDKEGKYIASNFPFGITSDGGIISNVLDLANYIKMYLNRGEFDGVRIVSRESIERMERGYVRITYEMYGGESYGYGLIIVPNFHGYKLVQHSGSVGVHTAYMGYIPEKRVGVAVLANAAGYPLQYIGHYALTMMLNKNPEELPMIKRDRILSKLEGRYETYKGTYGLEIKKKDGYLLAIEKNKYGENIIPLFPKELGEDKSTFKMISYWREYEVEFITKKDTVELIFERYKMRKITI